MIEFNGLSSIVYFWNLLKPVVGPGLPDHWCSRVYSLFGGKPSLQFNGEGNFILLLITIKEKSQQKALYFLHSLHRIDYKHMKKWFESREEIVSALKDAGYQLYGQNDNYAFIKPISGIHNHFTMLAPYFHAILDHQYPILNLHLDIPVFGGRHKTVQKDKRLLGEMHRIRTKTFSGQLDLVAERFMGRLINALRV